MTNFDELRLISDENLQILFCLSLLLDKTYHLLRPLNQKDFFYFKFSTAIF